MNNSNTRGVWIPWYIIEKHSNGELGTNDVMLLATINGLSKQKDGCTASNNYLAERLGVKERRVRQILAKLKKLKLIKQTGFSGRIRTLKTTWKDESGGFSDRQKIASQTGKKLPPGITFGNIENISLSEPLSGSDIVGGFGLVNNTNTTTTEFDITMATKLLDGCRKYLGSSHPNIRNTRVTSWAKHIRLLRTSDKVEEKHIDEVLEWYICHLGGEYIPEAYAGESFRKKFFSIERAYKKDVTATVTVSKIALAITERLLILSWPKGFSESLSAVVQASFTNYEEFLKKHNRFMYKLNNGEVLKYYRNDRERLYRFGRYITTQLPSPVHFVYEWLEGAHKIINKWKDWQGRPGPLIFTITSERFRTMGRGLGCYYANDPGRWDEYIRIMEKEME